MNMKKIMAGVVAAAAASAMAVSASAATITSDFTVLGSTFNDSGIFKIMLHGDGAIAGVDYMQVAGVTITLEYDTNDGEFWAGGAVVLSSDAAGWDQKNWASTDEDASNVYLPSGTATTFQWDACPFAADDSYAMIAIQEWANADIAKINVVQADLLDASGNVLLTLNASNVPTPADEEGEDEPAADDEGTVEPAPAQEDGGEDDAPAATEAPATTEAPAAGTGNTATTTPDKNNADTGVEGVAVVAGLAVIAAGAVIVAKKRG